MNNRRFNLKNKIKISVALPTYNGEQYLYPLLHSIATQTYPINELVVCDDVSKDKTLELLRDFSSTVHNFEIKLIANRQNLGLVKNISKALKLCNGQFIFLADQDDIWEKNKVETILKEYKNSNCEYFISNMSIINASGNKVGTTWVDYCEQNVGLSRSFYMNGCAVGATKRFFISCLPIPPGKGHDVWFAYCARRFNTRKYLNEPLMKYRVHESGLTSKNFIALTQKASHGLIPEKVLVGLRIYNYSGKSLLLRKIRTAIVRKTFFSLFLIKLGMYIYFLWAIIKWKTSIKFKD